MERRRIIVPVVAVASALALPAPLEALPPGAAAQEASSAVPPPEAQAVGRLYAGYWNAMLARNWAGKDACITELGRGCNLVEWQALISRLHGRERAVQLEAINRFVNRVPYRTDSRNWGHRDYWAAPREFFGRGGDCEDFAIVKYLSLRALGIPAEDLRVLVLWDARRATAHAVLAVADEGRQMILDNLGRRILPLAHLPHYQVHYSINDETVFWHLARD